MTVNTAQKRIDVIFKRYGVDIPEACEDLNSASLELARAFKQMHGVAWLVSVNGPVGDPDRIIWEWDGDELYNFGADFIIPKYSAEIEELIIDHRRSMPSIEKIKHIYRLVSEMRGYRLFWS